MDKFCENCGTMLDTGISPKCGTVYNVSAPFVLYDAEINIM